MPTKANSTTSKKKSEKKTLVLLDAHAILHRAYHALPDFASPTGEPTGALYGVVAMLLKIIEDFKPDAIVSCFDLPEPTYRHDAFADYKGTRSKTDDALVAQINRSRDIFAVFGKLRVDLADQTLTFRYLDDGCCLGKNRHQQVPVRLDGRRISWIAC